MVDAFCFLVLNDINMTLLLLLNTIYVLANVVILSNTPFPPPPLQKGRTKLAVSTIPLITASSYNCIYVDNKNSESGLHK